MNTYENIEVIKALTECWHCFTEAELLDFAETEEERALLLRTVKNDYRFVQCVEGRSGEQYFIAKPILYRWYVNLNIRLAKGNKARLDEQQLALLMSSLRIDGQWSVPPTQYIEFGQLFSFIRPSLKQSEYVFPLAHILSFMPPSKMNIARVILDYFNKDPWLELPSEPMVLKLIEDGLKKLPLRGRDIVKRREGLVGNTKMTLEQIGKGLNVTRERVRQIESKSWKRLRHPLNSRRFIAPLLFDIMHCEGSLLIQSKHMRHVTMFLTKCNSIPISTFPHTNIAILGASKEDMIMTKNIWKHALDPDEIANLLHASGSLLVDVEDLRVLAGKTATFIREHLTKNQKTYLALRSIGRPAHYANIAEAYHSIFPEDEVAEHSIHAKLTYNPHGVVWIGRKGTYALEEWGYERPALTLVNTVIEIVERKYAETGTPIPYPVILAELGKYRKIINPNSIVFVTYSNPRLIQVEGDCFIPRPIEESEIEDSAEELDKILQEFERQLGTYPSEGVIQ